MGLQVGEGIEQDLRCLWASEYRQPADDGAGMEVGDLVLTDAVTAAAHGDDSELSGRGISLIAVGSIA